MYICKLSRGQIEEALPLVWDVFCEYEAVNYPKNGEVAFYNAIHSEEFLAMLTAYGAFDGDRLTGIIATRNEGAHIALFFVDGEYHRRGIGRKLFEACLAENANSRITVNSSEYAADIYRKLGFVQTDEIQEDDGIRYIPMVFERET